MAITKKDIESLLDKKFDEYQSVILSAVNEGFYTVNKRTDKTEATLNKLMSTLDSFLQKITDFEGEFTLLRGEIDQIKSVLKSKFGIQISLQNPPRIRQHA